MFNLVRQAGQPLGDQVVAGLTEMIAGGKLAAGSRLPSVRQLAAKLGVSAYTVVTAYDRLVSRGLLEARAGAGYFVRRARPLGQLPEIEAVAPAATTRAGFAQTALDTDHPVLTAGSGFLPPLWFSDSISPATAGRLMKPSASGLVPAPAQGALQLRELAAERLQRLGVPALAGNLLITSGATQAFDLLARGWLSAGDTVLVEDPGYFLLHAQLEHAGLRLVSVPRQGDGPNIESLETLARNHRPRAFFMQTLLQNPTGGSTSAAKCHRVLQMAEKYDFHIVEDDVFGELATPHSLRLAQIDELQRVIYIGSYTKVLNPGLRIGYLAAPAPLLPQLIEHKMYSVLTGSALEELLVADALASGRFRKHIEQLRQKLARARTHAKLALERVGLAIDRQQEEGIFLWARLPDGVDPDRLVLAAQRQGILLAQGALFSGDAANRSFLRFNAAYCNDPRLIDFLERALPH